MHFTAHDELQLFVLLAALGALLVAAASSRLPAAIPLVCGGLILSFAPGLPHLTLPQRDGLHRIAHLHHNVPGVLANINGLLAEHKVNIEGQLLGTKSDLGYVLTDVAADYPAAVLDELAAMSETVRVRLLS